MTFDLFRLINYHTTVRSAIRCTFNCITLKKSYLSYLDHYSQEELGLTISKKLKFGKSTVEKYLIKLKNSKKCSLPLIFIKELAEILFFPLSELNSNISSLHFIDFKSYPLNAIKKTSIKLAEFLGAFAADGYFSIYDKKIKISEGYKDSLEVLKGKINDVFGYNSHLRFCLKDNTWNLYINSTVISRYFEHIFRFKLGKKAETVSMPDIIKNADFFIQKAFVRGVFTFDGCVDTAGCVELTTKSRKLVDDVAEILRKDGITFKIKPNKRKYAWYLESVSGRNIELLKKWKGYFFKDTVKYKRLQFFLGDIKINEIKELAGLFPGNHKNIVRLIDVYNVIKSIKKGEILDIQKALKSKGIKVANTTIYKYIYLLHKSNFIKKEKYLKTTSKNGFYKTIYYSNSNI